MTNTPPNGAFRGFGAPQTQFAIEVHMDGSPPGSGSIR
jgi:CO/xanthine dehydrogenase Mo-binding subunit